MAAGLVLADPFEPPEPAAPPDPHEAADGAGAPPVQQPKVIPVPGEVILRESTLPRPPSR
jgi:hypothetical protein